MAYTFLAKMYMNAQEWVGQNKFAEAVAACDEVIALGAYEIEDDYFANFIVHNENSRENIFVIPYHPQLTDEHFYWSHLTLDVYKRQVQQYCSRSIFRRRQRRGRILQAVKYADRIIWSRHVQLQ